MRIYSYIREHAGFLLAVVITASVLLHLTTIDISPVHCQDEIQVGEIARGGVGLRVLGDSLSFLDVRELVVESPSGLTWLGSFFHNLGYQMFGHVGPRLVQLFWLVVLAVLVFNYVNKKTSDRVLSFFLSIIIFAYPALCQSVRCARVDVLAFVFVFVSLMLLSYAKESSDIRSALLFVLAGFSYVCAVFTWISSVMLGPLILCEALFVIKERGENMFSGVKLLALCAAGAMIALVLLLLPFYNCFNRAYETLSFVASNNASYGTTKFYWRPFVMGMLRVPCFMCLGVLLLIFNKRALIATVGFALVAVACIKSNVYVYRMLYFVPYAVFGVVHSNVFRGRAVLRKAMVLVLCLMAVYSVTWSVGCRNVTEMFARRARDYGKMKAALVKKITEHGGTIYLDAYEVAFIARDLGWKCIRHWQPLPSKESLAICDCIIADGKRDDMARFNQIAESAGFSLVDTISGCEPNELNVFETFLKKHKRLMPLGPYLIYRKQIVGNAK